MTLYETLSITNIAKFDSVRQFVEKGNLTAAIALLSAIDDTNAVEEYCKMIFEIGVNKLNIDSVLAEGDSSIFYEIGNLHALTTGEAAFMSRNMLFYEVHDGVLGGSSRMAQVKKEEKMKLKVVMYPIPVLDKLYFEYKNGLPEAIEIFDIQQRCILKSRDVYQIDVASLSPGCFIVRFIQNNKIVAFKKMIKVK